MFLSRLDVARLASQWLHGARTCVECGQAGADIICEKCGAWLHAGPGRACYWTRTAPLDETKRWHATPPEEPYLFLCRGCRS